jgi:hypothetical protein
MFCPKCGIKLPDTGGDCPSCGPASLHPTGWELGCFSFGVFIGVGVGILICYQMLAGALNFMGAVGR